MLSQSDFKQVVKSTPLISIDMVVKDANGKVLLGKRTNKPAQNFWFVPGGRVLKDESLDDAFTRLLNAELRISKEMVSAKTLGVYQHFYPDNFSGDEFSTHYVVLAYEVQLRNIPEALPQEQHSDYRWLTPEQLLADDMVHNHSKWYFQENQQADSPFL
ncbi:GDP-mannose mannosyl hydrolase [Vibrio sp. 1262-1]|uniref:GDP-mannose mannosyl hydrolase n=1 Tax=Vibrio sp. 1262-1 TaxID=3074548 RepID=UPI002964D4BB|nr:GDP-mannose mannosyl hydrolase [Vibrio sp. 1262-1]MDW2402519.1 GDP-mannose mannosyl hydrolase [Vibrio sp. 1262-1]